MKAWYLNLWTSSSFFQKDPNFRPKTHWILDPKSSDLKNYWADLNANGVIRKIIKREENHSVDTNVYDEPETSKWSITTHGV